MAVVPALTLALTADPPLAALPLNYNQAEGPDGKVANPPRKTPRELDVQRTHRPRTSFQPPIEGQPGQHNAPFRQPEGSPANITPRPDTLVYHTPWRGWAARGPD